MSVHWGNIEFHFDLMFLHSLQSPPVIRYKSTKGKKMLDICGKIVALPHTITVICRMFHVQLKDCFYKRGLQKPNQSVKQVDRDHPSFTVQASQR